MKWNEMKKRTDFKFFKQRRYLHPLKGAETFVATFLLLKIKDLQLLNFGIMLLLTQKTKEKTGESTDQTGTICLKKNWDNCGRDGLR